MFIIIKFQQLLENLIYIIIIEKDLIAINAITISFRVGNLVKFSFNFIHFFILFKAVLNSCFLILKWG